ncbi:MAG: hypothetical protein U1E93_11380 [Alphaproteobacteria bacterium]
MAETVAESEPDSFLEASQGRHRHRNPDAPTCPFLLEKVQPGTALPILHNGDQPATLGQLGQGGVSGTCSIAPLTKITSKGATGPSTLDQGALDHFNLAHSIGQQLTGNTNQIGILLQRHPHRPGAQAPQQE